MTEQVATREPLQIVPEGKPVERVAESDRMLIVRMEARLGALQTEAQGLQGFVMGHLSATYKLQPGDKIEDDGRIVRVAPPAKEPA